jgi:hypothetical protein
VFGWNIRTRSDGRIAFDDGLGQVSGTWVLGRPPAEPGLVTSSDFTNNLPRRDRYGTVWAIRNENRCSSKSMGIAADGVAALLERLGKALRDGDGGAADKVRIHPSKRGTVR